MTEFERDVHLHHLAKVEQKPKMSDWYQMQNTAYLSAILQKPTFPKAGHKIQIPALKTFRLDEENEKGSHPENTPNDGKERRKGYTADEATALSLAAWRQRTGLDT